MYFVCWEFIIAATAEISEIKRNHILIMVYKHTNTHTYIHSDWTYMLMSMLVSYSIRNVNEKKEIENIMVESTWTCSSHSIWSVFFWYSLSCFFYIDTAFESPIGSIQNRATDVRHQTHNSYYRWYDIGIEWKKFPEL